jgi:FKBP-type peptidyl-prolyl cis-trans isomerase
MKKIFYFVLATCFALPFFSCNEKEEIDEEWKNANTAFYEEIKNNPDYQELTTEPNMTGPVGVYYKDLTPDNPNRQDSVYPFQTSNVKILYSGKYYNKTVFDAGSSSDPVELNLSSVIRGFSFALQNMVEGDKWEIILPYWLGYGEAGTVDAYYNEVIKGYSTLVFEVELVEIIKYPQ